MKTTLCIFFIILGSHIYINAQSLSALNKATLANLEEVTPFHEGLAAVKRGNTWGFINTRGELVIDFRSDLVWNATPKAGVSGVESIPYPRFSDGLCPVQQKGEDGIPIYGYINTSGQIAIPFEYLNLSEFKNGTAIGIYYQKTYRGKNNFQLDIYDYAFTEVVLNPQGEIIWPVAERKNILMTQRRYELPELKTRMIAKDLIAFEKNRQDWEIIRLEYTP